MKPFCVTCDRELKTKEIGVLAVSMGSQGPMECYAADLWFCPSCLTEIVCGFARMPSSIGAECHDEIAAAVKAKRRITYSYRCDADAVAFRNLDRTKKTVDHDGPG